LVFHNECAPYLLTTNVQICTLLFIKNNNAIVQHTDINMVKFKRQNKHMLAAYNIKVLAF